MQNKKIKILTHDYQVNIQDDYIIESDGETGKCNNYTNTITIAGGLAESSQKEILLHEILEALNYRLELGLEHRTICVLGETLNQVLSDNQLY